MASLDMGRGALEVSRAAGAGIISRFWAWYRAEARGLLPERIMRWLLDGGRPGLIVAVGPREATGGREAITLTPLRGARRLAATVLEPGEASRGAIARGIGRVRAGEGEVFLLVPAGDCLARSFDIPREAAPRLEAVLEAEVARRTPFSAADVVHGAAVSGHALEPSKLAVRHNIVRRDLAEAQAQRAGLTLSALDGLIAESPAGDEPVIMRITPQRARARWPGRTAAMLGLAGVAMLAAGFAATLQALDARQARVDAALTTASAKAQGVRQLVDGASVSSRLLASLRAAKLERPQLLDVIEELSRLLPEGTWVSELRLTEDKPGEAMVSITGYSDRATELVSLLERSQMFSGTALAAAITPDPQEGRDRFQLQTRLATTAPAAGASR